MNSKITDNVYITLNLNDGTYCPYRKPNEETNYIHVTSDHSSSLIKEVPRSIEKGPLTLLSPKNVFQDSAIYYKQCLKTLDIKLSYNIKNQKKMIKIKQKRKT